VGPRDAGQAPAVSRDDAHIAQGQAVGEGGAGGHPDEDHRAVGGWQEAGALSYRVHGGMGRGFGWLVLGFGDSRSLVLIPQVVGDWDYLISRH